MSKHVGITRRALHEPEVDCCSLVIAAVPVCAQAQKPSAAKVTKADVQKVFKIISGNKTKTQTYCTIIKLASQITEAASRTPMSTIRKSKN